MKHKKKNHKAHTMQHLWRPYQKSHLTAHQKNAMMQHQYLAAQNAMQDRINHLQRISYTGNPYIR